MNTSDIIIRLKNILNVNTDQELAKYLGVAGNTLAAWKSRNAIDFVKVIDKFEDQDLNWIFKGKKSDIGVSLYKDGDISNTGVGLHRGSVADKGTDYKSAPAVPDGSEKLLPGLKEFFDYHHNPKLLEEQYGLHGPGFSLAGLIQISKDFECLDLNYLVAGRGAIITVKFDCHQCRYWLAKKKCKIRKLVGGR